MHACSRHIEALGLELFHTATRHASSAQIFHAICLHCMCVSLRRVLGFWLALTFSTALQAAAFGILISRFNWQSEVARAAAMLRAAHHDRESH